LVDVVDWQRKIKHAEIKIELIKIKGIATNRTVKKDTLRQRQGGLTLLLFN